MSERWRADQIHAEHLARRAARRDMARRINDASLEHLIAVLRYSSLLSGLFVLPTFVAAALVPDTAMAARLVLAALFLIAWTACTGYLGWWYFGNSSWRGGKDAVPSDVPRPGGQG